MTPLQRLAADLSKIAARRWLRAGMDEAFVYGAARYVSRAFDPLEWLRPGWAGGGYRYAVTVYDPPSRLDPPEVRP